MSAKKTFSIKFLFFTIILLWCIGIFSEFLIHQFPSFIKILPFLKYNYSIVCHADPDKLLKIGEHSTLTCSRCTGIYLGSFISSFTSLFINNRSISTYTLLISSIPMLIDVLLSTVGLYNYSPIAALVTGLLLGSVGFFYIQNLILELLFKNRINN